MPSASSEELSGAPNMVSTSCLVVLPFSRIGTFEASNWRPYSMVCMQAEVESAAAIRPGSRIFLFMLVVQYVVGGDDLEDVVGGLVGKFRQRRVDRGRGIARGLLAFLL